MSCEERPIRGLLPEQTTAAAHRGTNARLLAGPGTGKTRVLVELVASLINEGAARSDEILCLTFTRAAAAGLRERVESAIGEHSVPVVMTLHAYALQQLMAQHIDLGAGRGRARVADDWEERNVVEEDLKVLLNETRIKNVRDRLKVLAAAWESSSEADVEERHGDPALIGALRQHKQEYRYVLRSELVFRLKEQLDANPFFPLSAQYEYIVVDEYQDLNPCDVAVIDQIAERGAVLYVAGDDDQSIYQQLRHANPQAIRDFVDTHRAADLRLRTCVRCDSGILDLALEVIRQEPRRARKELVAHATAGPGVVEGLAFPTGDDEAKGIAKLAKGFSDAGVDLHEILVLLRSDYHGAFSGPIKDALDALRVPSRVRTPEKSALDSRAGRQLLAMLRLALDSRDDLAWRTAFQAGALGVGAVGVAALHAIAVETGASFADAIASVEAYPASLGRQGTAVARAAGIVRTRLGDLSAAAPVATATVTEMIAQAAARLDSSEELDEAAAELEGLADLWQPTSLSDFLDNLALRKEEEEALIKNTVNIMTAHKAKGLDACVVIVAAAEEELFPGRGHIDEERRLFYVSLTRAKHALFVTYATRRYGVQAYAGTGAQNHERTKFLDGTGLRFRAGPAVTRTYTPNLSLLSPREAIEES